MTKFLHGVLPVVVEWVDSNSTGGWNDNHQPTDMSCVSVGLLVQELPDRIILAQSREAGGWWGDFIEIPRVAVKKIRKLK